MTLAKVVVSAMLSCIVAVPAWAFAAEHQADGARSLPSSSVNAGDKPGSVEGFGVAVSASALAHYSGGALVQQNQAINGTVANDSASQVTTGGNAIAGDSFSGAAGLPTVIQNTGNNVLIQNGVIVNVQMKP